MRLLKKIICRFLGCRFLANTFTSNHLYFCECCGREMFDRSWDDLEPMTAEEQEDFMRENDF